MDACPDCESDIKSMQVSGQHCNGHYFQRIEFRCGGVLSYSPNFSRIERNIYCGNKNIKGIKTSTCHFTCVCSHKNEISIEENIQDVVCSKCQSKYKMYVSDYSTEVKIVPILKDNKFSMSSSPY